MTLPDGEYEIDLSFFQKDPENTFAIRYGFSPNELDQSKPFTLYQTDQEVILKGQSTDKDKSTLIFEGIGKGSGIASSNDSFFLSFDGDNGAKIHKLADTLRVNKSRNIAKWTAKIDEWEPKPINCKPSSTSIPVNRATNISTSKTNPKIETKAKAKAYTKPSHNSIKNTSVNNTTNSNRNTTTNNHTNTIKKSTKASKRPPKEEPLISESDFEDLEDGESSFPQFSFPTSSEKKKDDEEDDFKDLEDQLQEVLEDEDESDEDMGYTGSMIEIDEGQSEPKRTLSFINHNNSNRKPMSLNEFVEGRKRNDEVSSEEE